MKDDKRLKRKVRNSYIISTLSVTLVLFLLGSVGYLMAGVMRAADSLKESISVTVELKKGTTEAQKEALKQQFEKEEIIRDIQFLSKEEKIQDADFRKMFDSQFEEVLGENPLLDSYELTLTSQSEDKDLVDSFLKSVKGYDGVDHVSFPKQMAERLHATVNKIQLVLLLFGGALLIISLILLNNTIRLAIFSKRYLINTMKLVGATKWFILKPFLWNSITQGLLAGLMASLLFLTVLYGLNESIPELLTMAEGQKIGIIVGAMILGGILISMLFTYWAVNKFVRMKSNKIYLY